MQGLIHAPRAPRSCEVVDLVRALAAHRVFAAVRRCGRHYTAAGVTVRVRLSAVAAATVPHGPEVGLLCSALAAGLPVTVTVDDPEQQATAKSLAPLRRRFAAFLSDAGIDRRLLGLCLAAPELPPPVAHAHLRSLLGEGPRYVLLGEDEASARTWSLLQQTELGGPRFWPALAAGVRSHCPLLSNENAHALLPEFGVAAPEGSAWLPLKFNICDFADADGRLRRALLNAALDACIDLGDCLFDQLVWFDRRQRLDAYRNRRLAICVSGFGDWVLRCGKDPGALDSLKRLDRLLAELEEGLWYRSKRLAASRGALPALLERAPQGTWRDETYRHAWHARWQAALTAEQVRHRNLLVLSPYAVLPRLSRPRPEFADLLPALARADAFSFSAAPPLQHWKPSDFQAFHRRVQALVAQHNAASFIVADA